MIINDSGSAEQPPSITLQVNPGRNTEAEKGPLIPFLPGINQPRFKFLTPPMLMPFLCDTLNKRLDGTYARTRTHTIELMINEDAAAHLNIREKEC